MASQTSILELLISDAEEEKKNLLLAIDLYETGKLATREKSGNEPWADTTESNLEKSRIDLGTVEERLARYAKLLKQASTE